MDVCKCECPYVGAQRVGTPTVCERCKRRLPDVPLPHQQRYAERMRWRVDELQEYFDEHLAKLMEDEPLPESYVCLACMCSVDTLSASMLCGVCSKGGIIG